MSYGAIIGDIAGFAYEWNPIKTKDFELFIPNSTYTDDSVCTTAVAEILLDGLPVAETLQKWGRKHPNRGYGDRFVSWLYLPEPEPYNSFGNGSAMRVSPVALLNRNRSLEEALATADHVTEVTHNHPEGIKGARSVTHAIWLALQEYGPEHIRRTIEREYEYDLSRTVDEIRPGYSFDVTCQGSVPEAITCALESTSFEDAVRNAVSLGGDSDTQAAIAGSIAEALHGVPKDIVEEAKQYIASDMIEVIERLYSRQDTFAEKMP